MSDTVIIPLAELQKLATQNAKRPQVKVITVVTRETTPAGERWAYAAEIHPVNCEATIDNCYAACGTCETEMVAVSNVRALAYMLGRNARFDGYELVGPEASVPEPKG